MFLYIRKCPLSNWRKSRRNNPNKCVKLEREICALRSLDNEWRSSMQKWKTIQTVRAVDALLLISISHNGNGQEAPPGGIFGSQQSFENENFASNKRRVPSLEATVRHCKRKSDLNLPFPFQPKARPKTTTGREERKDGTRFRASLGRSDKDQPC